MLTSQFLSCILSETMAEQNLEAKLKNLLKQEKIQLWNPPYTEQGQQQGQQHMQVGDPPEEAWPHTPSY